MEQRTKRLTQTFGAIGIAAGLGLGAAGLASAATSPSTSSSTGPSSNATGSSNQEQDPALNGSVQVPEQQGANDTVEAASLQQAAKITPDEAQRAALAAVPGTVKQVELDNENGSVVYSVEISANGATTDVKVDAGNGKVLAQAADHADSNDERGSDAGPEKAGHDQADNGKGGSEQPDTNNQHG